MDFIVNPLRAIIEFINTYLAGGYFPVAIIIFTVFVKTVLLPLDIKSRLSMRRMSDVQPKIAALNLKYKNDPEKLNQKTMELYKQEKVNPMGGCLPLLIQMPILFAMWSVLRVIANEELMQMFLNVQSGAVDYMDKNALMQSFLWVQNVWQPDNFMDTGTIIPSVQSALAAMKFNASSVWLTQENVDNFLANYETVMTPAFTFYESISRNGWGIMPLIVAGAQLLMTKLTPQQQQATPAPDGKPQNPLLKNMNIIMPVMFFFFCWGYLAAFSLYFLTSNLYSIAQNLIMNWYFDRKKKQEVSTVENP